MCQLPASCAVVLFGSTWWSLLWPRLGQYSSHMSLVFITLAICFFLVFFLVGASMDQSCQIPCTFRDSSTLVYRSVKWTLRRRHSAESGSGVDTMTWRPFLLQRRGLQEIRLLGFLILLCADATTAGMHLGKTELGQEKKRVKAA